MKPPRSMPNMLVKNIIFDWSGTLSNDFQVSYWATKHTLLHFGGPAITLLEYRNEFNLPVWKFYQRYLNGRGTTGRTPTLNEIDNYYFDHFSPIADRAHLYPNVKKLIRLAHRQKTRLFVFSTVRHSTLETLCHKEKIFPLFTAIQGSVRDKEKELPRFCKRFGFDPKHTLFIGDMEHDILAAKKTGILSGAFLEGYHSPERLLKHAPDFVWNDYGGMMKWLDGMHRGRSALQYAPTVNPIPTVGALIFNKGDIFLIQTHKWGHTFGIPGGKIKFGEAMEEALKREILEETNLKIKNIRFVLAQDSIHSKEFYKPKQHFLLLNFYGNSVSRNFTLNDEAEAGVWVNPEVALKLRLNQPTRKLIEHSIK